MKDTKCFCFVKIKPQNHKKYDDVKTYFFAASSAVSLKDDRAWNVVNETLHLWHIISWASFDFVVVLVRFA